MSTQADAVTPAAAAAGAPKQVRAIAGRMASIDALRGFDMFWLMGGRGLVIALAAALSAPWGKFAEAATTHTEWQGFTFWDFIAPLFLFIVGLSMPFSIDKARERGDRRRRIYLHIFKRTAMLVVLGWVTNGWLNLEVANFRYTSVLARIGQAYLIAALVMMGASLRGRALWAAGLLLGHWAVVALIPVPGFGPGVYTPQGSLEGFIDRMIPGKHCCYAYGDNMGPLGGFAAAGTVLLGVLCCHLLRSRLPDRKKLLVLIGGGVASLGLGLLWSTVLPIITKMWTGSYVLWANGWSMLLFALFYWIIDMRGYRKWAFPFVVIGMNAIFIYVLPTQIRLIDIANIAMRGVISHSGTYKPLVSAASAFGAGWLLLYFMYRKKIFLKL